MWPKQSKSGFTIIELLVVIVVIAILSMISIVMYNGIQERARDAQRLVDMKNISEALAVYKGSKKDYPNERVSGEWESSNSDPAQFISELKTSGLVNQVPTDPINDADRYYRYQLYSAGDGGCDINKGAFYVLQVIDADRSGERSKDSPGFSCANQNWTNEAWYTTGGYLYE